jgi:hypothetical protein
MNMKATSVELAVFKLKPGVSEAQFQRANQLCNQWLETCYGFIGRVLARPPEGQIWHDIVEWADLGCAKAAAEDFWHAPSTRDFIACVDCDAPEQRCDTSWWWSDSRKMAMISTNANRTAATSPRPR